MKTVIKTLLGLIAIAIFLSSSFPEFSTISHGINFISLDKEQGKEINNVGAAIVEAQTQRFVPNQDLVSYSGKVPVLMYHVVGNEFIKDINENIQDKSVFEAEMKWLHDNGYNTITPDQLYHYIKEKAPLPPNPIMLTFDDGRKDSYNTIFPILKNYNFTATMFIITKAIGHKGRLNAEDIKEMIDYGLTIGSHTSSHLNLASLTKNEMRNEIIDSKKILENMFGVEVNYFCYPSGRYDDMVLDVVKEAKYLAAFTTHFGRVSYGDDPIILVRVRMSRSDGLKGFIQKVQYAPTYKFTTPHHGEKVEKQPSENDEIGLGVKDNNKKSQEKDKNSTGNKGDQAGTDTDKSNGDTTPNNDNPADNNKDTNPSNGGVNPDGSNNGGNSGTGTGSNSGNNTKSP